MSRIAQVNHRRRLASQVASISLVFAAAMVGAAQVITATPASNNDSIVEVEPTKSPTAGPTAKPKPKPEPKQTVAPKPKPTETVAPKPVYEPKPTYTTKPKPTYTEKPVAGGLAVEMYPYDTAKAGAPMNWKVKAYDPSGRLLSIVVHFGDGSSTSYSPESACGEGTSVKQLFPHTYAKAGTYSAKAVVTTGGCGAATESKTAYGSVKVLSADYVGNGPSAPTVTAQQVQDAIAKLALHGADADGWVKKFYVDWGDGSQSYAGPRPFDGCQDGKPSSWDTYATHEYATPGTYTVQVTVLSTNCAADQGQTTTISLSVTV